MGFKCFIVFGLLVINKYFVLRFSHGLDWKICNYLMSSVFLKKLLVIHDSALLCVLKSQSC